DVYAGRRAPGPSGGFWLALLRPVAREPGVGLPERRRLAIRGGGLAVGADGELLLGRRHELVDGRAASDALRPHGEPLAHERQVLVRLHDRPEVRETEPGRPAGLERVQTTAPRLEVDIRRRRN